MCSIERVGYLGERVKRVNLCGVDDSEEKNSLPNNVSAAG